MQYLDQEGKVVYAAKDGKSVKVFPAAMTSFPESSNRRGIKRHPGEIGRA
jgi:hypothetical protein